MIIASDTQKVLGAIVLPLSVLFVLSSCASSGNTEVDTEVLYCIGACIHVVQKAETDTDTETEPVESKEL